MEEAWRCLEMAWGWLGAAWHDGTEQGRLADGDDYDRDHGNDDDDR
jgi:hypothetical protein